MVEDDFFSKSRWCNFIFDITSKLYGNKGAFKNPLAADVTYVNMKLVRTLVFKKHTFC